MIDYDELFGANSYVIRNYPQHATIRDVFLLLFYYPQLLWPALTALLLISGFGLFGKRTMVSDAVLFAVEANLHNYVYPGLSGGHELLRLLLLYSIFISMNAELLKNWRVLFLHRLGVLCVMAQLLIVYAIAAVTKLAHPDWQSGIAVWETMQVEHLRINDGILFVQANWLTTLVNYLVVLYQVLFPVLIWFKKTRLALLVIGLIVYTYIALVMGIVFFAFTMMAGHLIFWPLKPSTK